MRERSASDICMALHASSFEFAESGHSYCINTWESSDGGVSYTIFLVFCLGSVVKARNGRAAYSLSLMLFNSCPY